LYRVYRGIIRAPIPRDQGPNAPQLWVPLLMPTPVDAEQPNL